LPFISVIIGSIRKIVISAVWREVPVGETIEIKRAGKSFTYRIDFSEDIKPDKIGQYVYRKTDQSRILLVTCYRPDGNRTGSAPYRTVVGAYLESVKPLK